MSPSRRAANPTMVCRIIQSRGASSSRVTARARSPNAFASADAAKPEGEGGGPVKETGQPDNEADLFEQRRGPGHPLAQLVDRGYGRRLDVGGVRRRPGVSGGRGQAPRFVGVAPGDVRPVRDDLAIRAKAEGLGEHERVAQGAGDGLDLLRLGQPQSAAQETQAVDPSHEHSYAERGIGVSARERERCVGPFDGVGVAAWHVQYSPRTGARESDFRRGAAYITEIERGSTGCPRPRRGARGAPGGRGPGPLVRCRGELPPRGSDGSGARGRRFARCSDRDDRPRRRGSSQASRAYAHLAGAAREKALVHQSLERLEARVGDVLGGRDFAPSLNAAKRPKQRCSASVRSLVGQSIVARSVRCRAAGRRGVLRRGGVRSVSPEPFGHLRRGGQQIRSAPRRAR